MFITNSLNFFENNSNSYLISKREIHETLQICKSLTKRQIQYFNNIGCHGFEFATSYRALPSFVNDPLIKLNIFVSSFVA
jgi:hypothetical protein